MKCIDRFTSNVDKSGACWVWKGSINGKGYGQLNVNGINEMAHRYSYQMHKGTIPKGMFVMHSCDNRLCVNPDHLIVGTHRDNMDDMINKKRQAVGERVKSSKLTKEKVKEIRSLRKRGLMYKDIAVRFGVSAYHVKDICRFRVWKHVEG